MLEYYYDDKCMKSSNQEEAIKCYKKLFEKLEKVVLKNDKGEDGFIPNNPAKFVSSDTIQYIDNWGESYDGWHFVYKTCLCSHQDENVVENHTTV